MFLGKKKKAKTKVETATPVEEVEEVTTAEEAEPVTEEPTAEEANVDEPVDDRPCTEEFQKSMKDFATGVFEEPKQELAIDIELDDDTEDREHSDYIEDYETGGIVGTMAGYHPDSCECECESECTKMACEGTNVFDVMGRIADIYAETEGTEEDKQQAVEEFIENEVEIPEDNSFNLHDKEIPIDQFMYCRDMMKFVSGSIDRTIATINNRLEEHEFNFEDAKFIPDTRGSKVFIINHLLHDIMDELGDHREYIRVDEYGDHETVEDIVDLVRCAIALDDVGVRCNFLTNENMYHRLLSHQNLKLAVDSIVERSYATRISSGIGIIIMMTRSKVLKYQAMDMIMGTCLDIAEFIESHQIGRDERALEVGLDMEHMDEVIKCLADIDRLIR